MYAKGFAQLRAIIADNPDFTDSDLKTRLDAVVLDELAFERSTTLPSNRFFQVITFLATFCPCINVSGQEAPFTLHVQSDEVIVDLTAVDHSSYRPDTTLTRDDIIVSDGGKPVPLTSFDTSAGDSVRPLQLWLVVQCNLQGWIGNGSSVLTGHADLLGAGLRNLSSADTVGVAHWCDDGVEHLDMPPGHDSTAALKTLPVLVKPATGLGRPQERTGELSLQSLLRSISLHAAQTIPRPLPVLLFLHEDATGAPKIEVDQLLKTLLEQSAVAFVLNDGSADVTFSSDYLRNNTGYVLRNLAERTGGAAFRVAPLQQEPGGLSQAITTILERLHSRYQLSFVPKQKDGKVHTLKVSLTVAARQKHSRVILGSRSSYLAPLRKN